MDTIAQECHNTVTDGGGRVRHVAVTTTTELGNLARDLGGDRSEDRAGRHSVNPKLDGQRKVAAFKR